MKKSLSLLVGVILMATMLVSCGEVEKSPTTVAKIDQAKPTAEATTPLKVVSSISVWAEMAKTIGGDKVEVKTLIPPGGEPHDWEPTAADIVSIGGANAFIYNGADLEEWVEKVLKSTAVKQTGKWLDIASGMKLRMVKDDDHDHGDKDDKHDHDEDPHIWLEPELVKAGAAKIASLFSELDVANKAFYEDNLAKLSAELDKLDGEFKEQLASTKTKTFVTAHAAFGYLADRYGLEMESVQGLDPDSEPEPHEITRLVDMLKAHPVKTVFFESQTSDKVATLLANSCGATTDVLNTLESYTEAQIAKGETYFTLMRANLKALVKALD